VRFTWTWIYKQFYHVTYLSFSYNTTHAYYQVAVHHVSQVIIHHIFKVNFICWNLIASIIFITFFSKYTHQEIIRWFSPLLQEILSLSLFIFVLGGGTLWYLQKFLQYIKYIILEFTPSIWGHLKLHFSKVANPWFLMTCF
jgi:hypothetical protein